MIGRAEKDIVAAIMNYLAIRPDLVVWRQNVGALSIEGATGNRFIRFGRVGQADITGIMAGGRRLEIEVKGPKGRQSDTQREFEAEISRLGGLYFIARSVQDVIDALPEVGQGGKVERRKG